MIYQREGRESVLSKLLARLCRQTPGGVIEYLKGLIPTV